MRQISKVLIVGGGIGGLTAAVAFRRQGLEVDLVELKPEHAVHGVGIIQPGNALRALDSLGLLQTCLDAGFQVDDYVYYDENEQPLGRIKMKRIADQNLPAVNFLPRPALHHILDSAAREAGARIRMGLSVRTVADGDARAAVTFTDGSQGDYDLVVGADGIRSEMRGRLFGEQYKPRYTGHGVWRVTVPRPEPLTYQSIHYGVGVKAGLVPLSHDSMYLLAVTNEPGNPWFEHAQLADALKQRLAQFRGTMIPAVRDNLSESSNIIYVPIEEVILPAPWYRGRIVLLGDAAHASAPHIAQGASMAIEDACVLAEESARPQSVQQALERYMQRRYERCEFVQTFSRKLGEEGQLSDPGQCRERNERYRQLYSGQAVLARPHENILSAPI